MKETIIYKAFGGLTLAALALWVNVGAYPMWLEANASPLARISNTKKAQALHSSIRIGLMAHGEHAAGYKSTPCTSQIQMTEDQDRDVQMDDGVYYCTVTTLGGNLYQAEIELIVVNGEIWETPAILTPIDPETPETEGTS